MKTDEVKERTWKKERKVKKMEKREEEEIDFLSVKK